MPRLIRVAFASFFLLAFALNGTPSAAQMTISEARQQDLGTEVTVEGTVTRAYGTYARIQDTSGATGASAIVIRQASGPQSEAFQGDISDGTIQPGTTLEVTGTTSAFYGLIQINNDNLVSYTVQGQGTPPDPQSVTIAELQENGEDYESELLRLDGLRFSSASGSFENGTTYTVENAEGEQFEFRVQSPAETELGNASVPEGGFDYEGVLGQFHDQDQGANLPNEGYQFIPVRQGDLKYARASFSRLFSVVEEGGATVSVDVEAVATDGEVSVTAEVGNASTASNGTDVTGFDSPQTLTFSGSDPSPQTLTLTPAADDEQEGVERLEVVLSSDDIAISEPKRFTLWVADSLTAQAPIAQGDSTGVLLDALRGSYGDPPTLGYDRARDVLYRRVLNDQGTVETIYGGFQASADPDGDATAQLLDQDVNTEHLWPRSKGAEQEPALSNMYILAPSWSEANGYRCNYPFDEIEDATTERWIKDKMTQSAAPSTSERAAYTESVGNSCGSPSDDGRLEPRHSKKGDVARAVFYFAMAYPDRADLSFFDAQRETLLQWHRQDPVDATELRRSLVKASYQGNRPNPFVLDSTLASRAYPAPEKLTVQEARQQGSGLATVEGVVTRVGGDGPYVQDETGGVYVFESRGAFGQALGETIRKGTRLEVTGRLSYFYGVQTVTEVSYNALFDVLGQDEALPRPDTLTLGEIGANGEAHEAELVRVENFSIQADGDETFQASTEYTVEDETGTLALRIPDGSALVGTSIPARATFQGVLGQFNGDNRESDEPDTGYQLLAIEADDLKEELSGQTTIDVTRSFGDPSTGESYQLVGLAGQVDSSLASTLDGDSGLDWQAYWDDGTDQDYFVKFDGGDQFDFRPGRGFWLLNTADWSVEATVRTVSVEGGTATIPLHDGWNIVSNPLPQDVAWSDVEGENGGTLQALWRWNGDQFRQASTFTSATSGEAFYFLNDQALDQLSIPFTTSSEMARTQASAPERAVEVVAQGQAGTAARVRVAEHASASDGRDKRDWVAPPSQFAPLSLTVKAPFEDAPARQTQLARDVRSTGAPGQTYTLILRADTTGPVTLRAASLPRSQQTRAMLLNPATGERHNLRTDGPMTVTARPESTRVQLLVGTAAYVDAQAREQVPDALTVQPPAPNPFRDQVTLRYALPEAQDVRIVVYDLLGRQVQTLVDGRRDAGPHQTTWTGQDGARGQLASGTYLIRWSAGGEQHVEKVVLIR